jgi:hypothetical protein
MLELTVSWSWQGVLAGAGWWWWWISSLFVLKNMTKHIGSTLINKVKHNKGKTTQQHWTGSYFSVLIGTGVNQTWMQIRQPLSKTCESEEERAVLGDVTKGPCTSTSLYSLPSRPASSSGDNIIVLKNITKQIGSTLIWWQCKTKY